MRQLFTKYLVFLLSTCAFAQPLVQSQEADSLRKKTRWVPNPTVAALLSTAVPGAGQIYSRAYWHSIIFLAAEGYCAWRAIDAAQTANEMWNKRTSLSPGTQQYEDARIQFEYSTTERNTYLWFLAGAKLLDIADAYVSAHLYDFEYQMEASLSVLVLPQNGGAKVSISFRF